MKKIQLLVVGQGPAGLSAAIYAARANIETLVAGLKPKIDGEYDIENYFGFEEAILGSDLMAAGRRQAERFGVEIRTERVLNIHWADDGKSYVVRTESEEIQACSIILAAGVSRSRPGISNLDDYDGKGVSYCVSCDGFFYRGRPVMVLGEGVYAANQALDLTTFTPDVTICTQGKEPSITPEFTARLDEAGIKIITKKIESLEGDPALAGAIFDDGEKMAVDGLFIAMGEASASDFAKTIGLEQNGVYIAADQEQKTNMPGIFAAGDCVGRFLQIAVAVGEGALAARGAISYVKKNCPAEK